MALVRLQGSVAWQLVHDPYSDRWVGICDTLGITAEGETWQEPT